MNDQFPTGTLGDLVTLQTDRVFVSKNPDVPYVGLEHIAQGSPRLLGVGHSHDSASTNTMFAKNDILFGKLRPNLRKSLLANFNGYCSTDILVLRPKPGVDPSFAKHVFQSETVFALATSTAFGTKMPRTSWADLKNVVVFMPPLSSEQAQIALVLDAIDELIEKIQAVIAKLRKIRTGLLHDLLTLGLDERGKLRDPVGHPEQFQPSPLGPLPACWDIRSCESLCKEIVVGIVVRPAQYYVNEGVPVLRSANVRENGIDPNDLVYITPESNAALGKSILHEGDLVTVRTGYPGTSCVVPSKLDGSNCVDLIISRPKKEILPDFLALWVNSPFGKDQILRRQGGLAQQHFNVKEMKALLVAKPEPEEQKALVETVRKIDELISAETVSALKFMTAVRPGMMTDMLSGDKRVPEGLDVQCDLHQAVAI